VKPKAKHKKPTQQRLSVVGMNYRVTPSVRRFMVSHLPIRVSIEREPDNPEDSNAIAVTVFDKEIPYNKLKIGYLRRQVAAVWAPAIDEGTLKIHKTYLIEIDVEDGTGELLMNVSATPAVLKVGS
jgi:hypothetical protein